MLLLCLRNVRLKKKHITRFITLVLALQLLNLSIYAQDFKPLYHAYGSDDTNIDETIVEYVVEVWLGHTNAFPEVPQTHKDMHVHKHMSFKVIQFPSTVFLNKSGVRDIGTLIPLREFFINQYQQDIRPQPPKAYSKYLLTNTRPDCRVYL